MKSTLSRSYAQWKAPRVDGQVLIWPEPADLLRIVPENHDALEEVCVPVQGVALNELRRHTRTLLEQPDDRLLIATGHQTELYHPGVWVKNVLISEAAEKMDATGLHLSVDTDSPKHLQVRWPNGAVGLTDDPLSEQADWSGRLDAPGIGHLQAVRQRIQQASRGWDFQPCLPEFFDIMTQQLQSHSRLAPLLAESFRRLDEQLGVPHQTIMASPLWNSAPFLVFVHHLLARASQWAQQYNRALHEYRRQQAIHRPGHPMPDLAIDPDQCEAAFWLDHLSTGERDRLMLTATRGRWALVLGENQFVFDPDADAWHAAEALGQFLHQSNVRISPRALTLTAFIRIFAADLFVHGIGGGRYDQVCDRIIASFFGIEPPAFAVTTATLYFPAAAGRQRTNLSQIEHEGHQLRHRVLGEAKQHLVQQIHAAPRNSLQRSRLFRQMQTELAQARHSEPIRQWQARYTQAQQQAQEDAVLFDRELFYALQPRPRLMELVDRCHQAFAGA